MHCALTLALVRRLPASARAQAEHRWADELGGLQLLRPEGAVTTLIDAEVLIWGFGAIGQTIAALLAQLGAHVRGVDRTAGERSGFSVIAVESLEEQLERTDVLLMVLPSTAATNKALDMRRLAALPPHAAEQIDRTRDKLARHLELMAGRLASDQVPSPAEERRWIAALGPDLDRMRRAEALVERARQANPRARRWQEAAARVHAESRALDRVAVLIDDLTALVSQLQPHRRGDRTDPDTAELVSDALAALAGVLRNPYHSTDGTTPDPRSEQIRAAVTAMDRLVERLSSQPGDRSLLPLSAVVVGVQRGLLALGADHPD